MSWAHIHRNPPPSWREAHRRGQRRRWGLDKLSEEQLAEYMHLRRHKRHFFNRAQALELVLGVR